VKLKTKKRVNERGGEGKGGTERRTKTQKLGWGGGKKGKVRGRAMEGV